VRLVVSGEAKAEAVAAAIAGAPPVEIPASGFWRSEGSEEALAG